MFAIAFDLTVADAKQHHPKSVQQAYADIEAILAEYGFNRAQGSVYVTDHRSMANLYRAIESLRDRTWFRESVRDIRAFRMEDGSDFTAIVKGVPSPRASAPRVKEPMPLYG